MSTEVGAYMAHVNPWLPTYVDNSQGGRTGLTVNGRRVLGELRKRCARLGILEHENERLTPALWRQHRVFAGEESRLSDWEIRNGN